MNRPYTLIAELTYRCPLACAYCSNPLDYGGHAALDTSAWNRILREAEDLGVVQLHVSGGEPLLRDDLEDIIEEGRRLDLYVNLVTSGIPLTRDRLKRLRDCGLDAIQLSFQAARQEESDQLAGIMAYDRKVQVARWIVELGLPLTINVVLHRGNIDETTAIIAFAERLGAQRLELANTQYLGWALLNRQALLPSLEQIQQARALVEAARLRLLGKIEILFVTADYYGGFPRACMDGWGRRYLVVAPDGRVLPCHAAHTIPGLPAAQASATSLREIWEESELFNIFRGESWMPAPCNSCDRRRVDYGGCRCQAFHLTGHASNTDPVCRWAPEHGQIQAARAAAEETKTSFPLSYRTLKMVP